MTRPRRYLIRMLLFLVAVGVVLVPLFKPLSGAFLANAPLNGAILAVMILGILYNLRQVITLNPEVDWIENFRRDGTPLSESGQPRLLGPMATMLGQKTDRLTLSTSSMRTLLDGIVSRLDESRDLSRYTIGLLIFLGLLGTFWGLLVTVGSVGNVISGLSASGDAETVFADLQKGLETPLAGMGTAFSSSLFGLAGSLILGFLDLQASQAQNRFYNDLEEWLSSLTRLSSGALSGDGDQSVPAYVQALLEQTAESLENLQRILARGEESRISVNAQILSLTEKLDTLTEHMKTEQVLMKHMAESQMELKPALMQLADSNGADGGFDKASRESIRNLDRHVTHLAQEMTAGRDEIIREMRSEIKFLARTIAAISEGEYER